jgi:hypothetical protein
METQEFRVYKASVVKSDLLDLQETQVHLAVLDSLD